MPALMHPSLANHTGVIDSPRETHLKETFTWLTMLGPITTSKTLYSS